MLILFFGRNSISLYDEHSGLIGAAEIGKEIYNHLEISEHNIFHQFIGKFLEAHKVSRQKISIVLTEEITFVRNAALSKEVEVPLKNSVDIYKTNDNLIYSFNAEILNCMEHNLAEIRYKLFGIFPAQLFNLSSQDALLETDVKEITTSVKRLNKENLLLASSRNSARRVELLLLGNLVFMFVLLGVVARNTKLVNDIQVKSTRPAEETTFESKTNETTKESTIESKITLEEQKQNLKIQVLNGSGKTGVASKVQNILEKSNFTVSSIGNTTEIEETIIEINEKSTADFIAELEKTLTIENTNINSMPKETTAKNEDIIIKIGKSFKLN